MVYLKTDIQYILQMVKILDSPAYPYKRCYLQQPIPTLTIYNLKIINPFSCNLQEHSSLV